MTAMDQNAEHTGSYYAATRSYQQTYAPLDGAASADVCVIGGGFTGIATALTLAERGYKVVVLEANRVGWGASGRNGGQLINGIGGLDKIRRKHGDALDELLWDMRWRGHAIVRERVEKYGIDCDFTDGYVEVARKPSQVAYTHEAAEELERRGFPHRFEVWDRAKTEEKLGTRAFHGGFINYYDGHLHPLNLCAGEAHAAAGLGVRIHEQSPVTGIAHGKKALVSTANGSVEADAVMLAGNAYSRLEPKHLSNLIFPAGSYMLATEPLAKDVIAEIMDENVAVCDLNNVVDYYRVTPDGRLLYGGACNYSGRDPSDITRYILPRLLKVYPQLAGTRIDYEWGGKIGIVLNRTPTVGRIHDNVYYCQGYSGHGVSGTHLMGEVMADAIDGTLRRFDLFAGMKHYRLPGSRWVGNQIIALGMMYYKLQDML